MNKKIFKTMQHEKKNFVYLQRLSQSQRAARPSVMLSVSGFFNALRAAIIPAAYQPRESSVMGDSALCVGLRRGKWHVAFFVPQSLKLHKMKHTNKTAGETANTITFNADWLDFTEHLTNAQVGRLLRCVARYERGDINPQHVAELRKDAAVGVAYNFITEQLERRAR